MEFETIFTDPAAPSLTAMLKWAVTSRGLPTLTPSSGLPMTSSVTDSYVSAPRATAWPTYHDVSVAQPRQARWSTQWLMDDDSDDDDRDDSLSAYNDNSCMLEQMIASDFNDDSQVSVHSFIHSQYIYVGPHGPLPRRLGDTWRRIYKRKRSCR